MNEARRKNKIEFDFKLGFKLVGTQRQSSRVGLGDPNQQERKADRDRVIRNRERVSCRMMARLKHSPIGWGNVFLFMFKHERTRLSGSSFKYKELINRVQIGFRGCREAASLPGISAVLGKDHCLRSSGKMVFLEPSSGFVFNTRA